MKEYHKRATPFYSSTIPKDLNPLTAALGGDYDSNNGADIRNYNATELRRIQEEIWPMGITQPTDPVMVMKRKYKKAFGYVANRLFNVAEEDALLATSQKLKWQVFTLNNPRYFVHATKRGIKALRKGGLKSKFASEVCYNGEGIGPGTLIGQGPTGLSWDTHKFVFMAPAKMKGNQVDTTYSGGGVKGQGFGNEIYYVLVPAGTDYMCAFDIEAQNTKYQGEVAFLRDFDRTDIYVSGNNGLVAI